MKKLGLNLKKLKYLFEQEYISLGIKRCIYVICFACLCLIDQVTGSATGAIQYGLKNYTGIIIAVIILSAYQLKEFYRTPILRWASIAWILLFFIGRYYSLDWGRTHSGNYLQLQTNLWGIGIYGIVLIRMLYGFIAERKVPRMNWPCFGVWLVMAVGMAVIRSDIGWTEVVLITFLSFYLTDFKEKDLNNLFSGMLEGVIVGFFVIQVQAWMHRPYDILRYHGMYSHPNTNALFYLCAYCAVLGKWYLMKLKHRFVLLRVPFILLAGLIVATMFYTGSRSAFITVIPLTLVFLLFQMFSRKRWKLLEVLIDGGLLVASVAICVLPAYGLIRYIPVNVDEPIYFEADKIEEKIQKGDDAYSEKYVEFNEATREMFDRYLWFLDEETALKVEEWIREFPDSLKASLKVEAAEASDIEAEVVEEEIEPGTDPQHPLDWTMKDLEGYDVRLDIYRYFLNKLKLMGEKGSVQGVWLSSNYLASHCHNLFLQMAYDFGIIIGIVFILIVLMIFIRVLVGLIRKKSGAWYFRLYVVAGFTTIFVVFGMTECVWIYGQLPFTMFFIVQYVLYHKGPDAVVGKRGRKAVEALEEEVSATTYDGETEAESDFVPMVVESLNGAASPKDQESAVELSKGAEAEHADSDKGENDNGEGRKAQI